MIALRQAQGIPILGQLDGAQHSRQNDFLPRIRLGNKVNGAQRQALHLRVAVGGRDNDRQAGGSGVCLDLTQNVKSAEIRQIQIQQDQTEHLILRTNDVQSLRSRSRHNKVIAVLQEHFQDLLVDILILDQQDTPSVARRSKGRLVFLHSVFPPVCL